MKDGKRFSLNYSHFYILFVSEIISHNYTTLSMTLINPTYRDGDQMIQFAVYGIN